MGPRRSDLFILSFLLVILITDLFLINFWIGNSFDYLPSAGKQHSRAKINQTKRDVLFFVIYQLAETPFSPCALIRVHRTSSVSGISPTAGPRKARLQIEPQQRAWDNIYYNT